MPEQTDPTTGFVRDMKPEPTRPLPYASSADLAARQTARALERLRAAGATDVELADARRRLVSG
jgi:hypothetical protein